MSDLSNRRPLASRKTAWASKVSRWLAGTGISPNQISMLGMIFALIAGASFWGAGGVSGAWRVLLLLLGAAMTQGRLLCNLFDGMVAIEAGKRTRDGGFWNEFPDRISDALILFGLALGAGEAALGWAAVSFAFLTAYVRELGVNNGVGADFSGPMAKQHRMALVTTSAILTVFAPLMGWRDQIIHLALWLIVIGSAATALRRAMRQVRQLRRAADT
ncbi:CDP-alcohol phosphatidyltransferase family protein [Paracoccus sp. (in: a-proteobacteria)]|uniref:CDP-alcohol phosphatidyltransferase family protein n=1 Tax=Paracoccus sp. TaxID=267 RepID=UPI002896D0DE|nr:CDP-alcohol phosphatidyltransferase family protein [Paracoccus sp. (in: a-proteobacteria)]